ncbi:glycosyltransferase family 2 protein [bacterium]|nr:glycosyltransferase family 2 protein [bacterium]NDC95230.1 glycosyltransferase family 2 protein [bacterium]NDD84981.1 glycosyltransferase family 2 protein [bacterium]NDG31311.1 glycosyltransferase family 2 protein [bacterium]
MVVVIVLFLVAVAAIYCGLLILHTTKTTHTKNLGSVAIATLMRKPIDLPLWLKHHRNMGISHFFIRLEDSPGFEDYLAHQPDITLEIGQSDTKNNYTSLQSRQINFVNKCIKQCNGKGITWLFHIDADELLHGNITYLDTIDPHIKVVRLENAEAMFDESQNTCFQATKFLRCGLSAPCRSYANGKSGGRVCNELSLAGPHHFAFQGQYTGNHVLDIPFDNLCVLHFDSCSFGAWVEKFLHLSKQDDSDTIPFPYYHDSINAAKQAYEIYTSRTHINKLTDQVLNENIYQVT